MVTLDHNMSSIVGLAAMLLGGLLLEVIAVFVRKGRKTTLLCGMVLAVNALLIAWNLRVTGVYRSIQTPPSDLGVSFAEWGSSTLSSTWFMVAYGALSVALSVIAGWRLADETPTFTKRAFGEMLAAILLLGLAAIGVTYLLAPFFGEYLSMFIGLFVASVLSYPTFGRGRLMPVKQFGHWTFLKWCAGCGALFVFTFLVSQITFFALGV
ncbi:MAG: hypothetical protein LC113_13015 [Acidobacteria bacterium]|nr:hypothetical protein [Acidobacteriota bacterium]